jgi:acetyltransferase-like isoleucine patch superfamily enzyme
LATGAIVLPGVTVGQGTVVAAGSLVTKDLPARHLCIGSPCRPVREL